jgi:hypothetical protein
MELLGSDSPRPGPARYTRHCAVSAQLGQMPDEKLMTLRQLTLHVETNGFALVECSCVTRKLPPCSIVQCAAFGR